ncbi:hypothetical protein Aduo_001259 [Ancylostoma duodenale]
MRQLLFVLGELFISIRALNCPEGNDPNTQDHCIHMETTPMTWNDAEAFCVARGGHLTSVHNQYDNNAVRALGDSTTCKYYWTGGLCTDGKCTWTDGSAFDFTFWDKGQPDSKSCTSVYSGTGEWHTIDCNTKECFVCETPQAMTDCADWYKAGYKDSGVYRILLNGVSHNLYCDMGNGGGWTVFQSRVDGNESFWDRKWDEYKNGFNTDRMDKNSNFWLGLELVHQLSMKDPDVTLRIEMRGDRTPGSSTPNDYWYIEFTKFQIGSESTNYLLNNLYLDWKNIKGNASTGWYDFSYSVGAQFSTVDRINDPQPNCVTKYKLGGWWLRNCALSSLNGDYAITDPNNGYGMFWIVNGLDDIIHPRESVMMLRPTPK